MTPWQAPAAGSIGPSPGKHSTLGSVASGRSQAGWLPVLTYHAIGSRGGLRSTPWITPEALFEEQVGALREAGCRLLPLTGALRAKLNSADDGSAVGEELDAGAMAASGRVVALTFDDGYADFAEHAFPVLDKVGAKATLFVVSDCVGTTASWLPFGAVPDRRLLGWSDLIELAGNGIEIGSHGCRHLPLDTLPVAQAREEIYRSRMDIAERIGLPEAFAYPFGYHNAVVRSLVARAGYYSASEVGRGLFSLSGDRMRVRRLLVDGSMSPEQLVSRLTGPAQLPGAFLREMFRPVWRGARRLRQPIWHPPPAMTTHHHA